MQKRLMTLLFTVLLGATTALVTGCPPPGDGDGETCTNPIAIQLGATVTGSTANAAHDHSPPASCTQTGAGGDLVYSVTLTEAGSLTATVTGDAGFDPIVYIAAGGCSAAQIGACSDVEGQNETATRNLVPAGTYLIIVDTYIDANITTGGGFSLVVTSTAGGQCDDLDVLGTTTAEDPAGAGWEGIAATQDFDICPGTPDWVFFGNLGGAVQFLPSSPGDATFTFYKGIESQNEEGQLVIVADLTDEVGTTSIDGVLANGWYVVKADTDEQAGGTWEFSFVTSCEGDAADVPGNLFDDKAAKYASTLTGTLTTPLDRTLCIGDQDGFRLGNLVAGDVTVTFTGGGALVPTVAILEGNDDDGYVETPIAEGVDFISTVAAGNLELSMTAVPAGANYIVRLAHADGATDPAEYQVNAVFTGVNTTPPANDECADAIALTVTNDGAPLSTVFGWTTGGNDSIRGACNNEGGSTLGGQPVANPPAVGTAANDVFYSLTLAAETNLEIRYSAEELFFFGSVYLLEAICPVDPTTPAYVLDALDKPRCRADSDFQTRYQALPAGEYIVVVDGVYFPGDAATPAASSFGAFELSAVAYPAGFPVPQACLGADVLALPANVGDSLDVVTDTSAGNNDIPELCNDQSLGKETVWLVNPATDMRVRFETAPYDGTQDDSFDTMLEVRYNDCIVGTPLICQDDIDPGVQRNSNIEVDLIGGETYYLILDGWGGTDFGVTTLTTTRLQ